MNRTHTFFYQPVFSYCFVSCIINYSFSGIERVLRGDYAFLMESTMNEYTRHKECELMQVSYHEQMYAPQGMRTYAGVSLFLFLCWCSYFLGFIYLIIFFLSWFLFLFLFLFFVFIFSFFGFFDMSAFWAAAGQRQG